MVTPIRSLLCRWLALGAILRVGLTAGLSTGLLLVAPHPVEAAVEAEPPASEAPYVVIVHPSSHPEEVNQRMLREIALGKVRFWRPQEPIQLIIEPSGGARDIWTRDLAGMNSTQFTQYWMGLAFQGRATIGPRVVPDVRTAVAMVAALPGSIAIVPASEVDGRVQAVSVGANSNGVLSQKLR